MSAENQLPAQPAVICRPRPPRVNPWALLAMALVIGAVAFFGGFR